MKLKPALLISLLFLCSFKKGSEKIQWMKLDDITVKIKQENKPVLIDLYTDWCYWCKVMDKKTYSNSKVIDYINEHFYSARVNAETKDAVTWNDKTFNYNNQYRINDFALFVTGGRASFPTTVILLGGNEPPIPIPGFMEPKEFEMVVKYFGDGEYKTKSFPEYQKTFKASW